ncbi:MAG: D-alanine--D-alanine ligase [Planctomycetota bacterium]
MRNPRIAVLMGGVSEEREVSLKSGRAVVSGLKKAGYEAMPFDVTERSLEGLEQLNPDAAFVALHGSFGEDGEVQRLLENRRLPYTGSGPRASERCMDKLETKRTCVRNSIPTADYAVARGDEEQSLIRSQARELGYPLVCKPVGIGSSVGISLVRGESQLDEALECAFETGQDALLERYIRGRELTVGVLQGRPLPMVEIVPDREFFDYHAKYKDENTDYITPVALLETVYRRAVESAVNAYESLDCRHFARVDLIHGYDGSLHVMEINTIPGFTPRSLLPMAASEAGMEFPDLCGRIVEMALKDAEATTSRRAG